MIKKLTSLFRHTKDMANAENRRFVPTPEEMAQGKTPLEKSEIIKAIAAYKLQNPVKYEAKKKELFKKYGIEVEPAQEIDEEMVKLEAAAKKAKKLNIV